MPAEPLVKVCGVRHAEVIDAAISAGAGALGLNFVPASRRALSVGAARRLLDGARGRHQRLPLLVGVFADADPAWVEAVRGELGLDWVQLHGRETPDLVSRLMPAFKGLRLGSEADLDELSQFPGPWVLIDARVPGQLGGTGRRIPGSLAARASRLRPVILAGGLDADNVADAIAEVRPAGVDSASGCEDRRGQSSPQATHRFVINARAAFAQLAAQHETTP